ncbi:DUF481 domain-containing protein [Fimbriiglobus ruber]|uniref:DUF481 domain-containing protein n=1 Tax=Fimbriiglobus ruber TaxID=1908690 RepID=A0A225DPY1_9BACT|nr:DUF481 domain-containing protein [Fimbriiglobus ruber]OWK43500.1 hypothetical protein FRUB_03099 [Fimbriiglobus ruber]
MPRWVFGLGVVIAILVVGQATGQTGNFNPAGGGTYFGAPQGQAFNADSMFKPPPAAPPAPATPTTPAPATPAAIGAGADGGLLPAPPPPPPPKIWTGSADLGLNGTDGNSNTLNMRTNWNVQRKVTDNVFVSDLVYTYSRQNGSVTASQALYNVRDEVLFLHTPWTVFTSGLIEYDELRAYRFRIGAYAGVGYVVVDDADITLRLRTGFGVEREIGSGVGVVDQWVPEMLFGYDFRYKFNDRSSFLSIVDFYPQINDWAVYRVRARAAYEYILDPKRCIIMRLGVQDRYDSNPGPAERNDVAYFATLGMKF